LCIRQRDARGRIFVAGEVRVDVIDAALRRAFFNVLTTSLMSGAGQVKVATGLAPGQETIVVFNDTLKPVFKVLNFV